MVDLNAMENDQSPEGSIVTFCNPLLDVTANVEFELLERYGLEANNAILADEKHIPLYEELATNHEITYSPGGAGQNAMRACLTFLPPGSGSFIGCVGVDNESQILRNEMGLAGVRVEYLEDPKAATGICGCLITDGGKSRSLVAKLGAANNYKISHLQDDSVQSILKNSKFIYITGFFLTVSPETAQIVAAMPDKCVCLNLAAPFICQFYFDQLNKLLPFVDFLFGNESEFRELSKSLKLDTENLMEVASILSKFSKKNSTSGRTVIMTRGPDPTIVSDPLGKITTYPVPPIPSEEVINTNGAGDAFVGAFLAQLILGKPMEVCVNSGHELASKIIRKGSISF